MNRILKYIIRSWEDVDTPIHPRMKLLPPIIWDLFGVVVAVGIICNMISYFIM